MDWSEVQYLFEWEGSLLDIYVFDTEIAIWQQLLAALDTSDYILRYSEDSVETAVPKHVSEIFAHREQTNVLLTVVAGRLSINCHFFTPHQIEFDIDPREVNDAEAFLDLRKFMRFLGQTLGRSIVLTPKGFETMHLLTYEPQADLWQLSSLVPSDNGEYNKENHE